MYTRYCGIGCTPVNGVRTVFRLPRGYEVLLTPEAEQAYVGVSSKADLGQLDAMLDQMDEPALTIMLSTADGILSSSKL